MDRKSTSGYCFTLGSVMVSWCNRKQSSMALSTAEAEYIALIVAVPEAVWLRKLLTDLFDHEMDPTIIHCDNQSYVNLSENPVFHTNSKHIEIKYQKAGGLAWCTGAERGTVLAPLLLLNELCSLNAWRQHLCPVVILRASERSAPLHLSSAGPHLGPHLLSHHHHAVQPFESHH